MKVFCSLFVMMAVLFSCKKDEGSYHGGYYWIYGYGLPVMGGTGSHGWYFGKMEN
ncbi:hypothetical protein BN1195_01427 [Chryseobacterium oranimense G311]|uniref:hypothetical protein n=1 Tax=Chryseobacterium oranimense TaxID=421058 RepID=UPI000533A091|nr:hypothetical protein [Chryseobacterium oranimense]CEJ69130.1 hypothetical protein BN1195_01427 [Chryseobacterium oranimense G311]